MPMLPLDYIVKVVVITSSGTLSPGPMTASTIAIGSNDGWKNGFKISIGHMIVEFPLVLLIALGITTLLTIRIVEKVISFTGGTILILLGILMFKDTFRKKVDDTNSSSNATQSPIMIGILLSLLNPYFLVWWILVGGSLIIEAVALAGLMGVGLMFIAHIWMDYAWLMLIAELSRRGKQILKTKGYKVLLAGISLALIFFGLDFISLSIFGSGLLL